jgi:poly(3-hydroxybutyrate) depolymerase
MKRSILTTVSILLAACAAAQTRFETQVTTHLFGERDGKHLMLDRYTSPQTEGIRPCMIFVFGGGFTSGERNAEIYIPYYEFLAGHGIDVVAIDYRLGLENIDPEKATNIRGMISTMKNAVDMAVEDLYLATSYVLEHAEHWQIDPRRIIISGSSAGAITVLQAENGLCNSLPAAAVLPAGFRYAGVIACAGAIFSTDGKPHWDKAPAPIMFFHGDADSNVPYKKASLMGIGYYGPQIITRQLDKLGSPYYFYSAQCVDHSLAVTPLEDKLDLILQFIRDYIDQGRRLRIRTDVEKIDCKGCKTRFSIRDYLSTNYAPQQ